MRMASLQANSESVSPRLKWSLTKEAFDRLLLALDGDSEEAGQKYNLLLRNLVRYFEGRGCQSAEDHADEAVNRIAKRLGEGEDVRDINGYAYGVARLLLLEIAKDRARQETAFKELSSSDSIEHPPASDEDERLECLNHCLAQLPDENRRLIIGYYDGDHRARILSRQRLADSLGIPNQALRSRAVRLREKLETCLSACAKKKQEKTTQTRKSSH